MLVHVLRLARQPDLLLQVLHLGLVRGEISLVLLSFSFRRVELGGVFGLALAEDVALRQLVGIGIGRVIGAARELGVEPVVGRTEIAQLGGQLAHVRQRECRV